MRRRFERVMVLLCFPACGSLADPALPSSIAFDSLPFPAVALGDTLRDESGAAAALVARVFDGRGREIEAPVQYVALGPGVRITPEGFVIGESLVSSVRLAAVAGGLQSVTRSLGVTLPPHELVAEVDGVQIVEYTPLSPINSAPLAVRAVHRTSAGGIEPVAGWRVRYAVAGAAPGDTIPGVLVDDVSRRSVVDTTDATGRAARRYRLFPPRLTALVDTIEVTASVRHLGADIAGSPVRFLLILRPQGAS